MRKIVLKAGENTEFYIAMATMDKEKTGNYTAILTLCDPKRKGKYVVSEIKVSGKNKNTIIEQVKTITNVFSPIKDIYLIDVGEMMKDGEA